VFVESVYTCVQGDWLEQCVCAEPEVLWVDIDKLLPTHVPQQQQYVGVTSQLEAELVTCIIRRLVEVRDWS